MAKVMPNSVADLLNPVEIALLIMAANFHDQGMVLKSADFDALPTNESFRRFQDNWIIEHPNFTEVRQHLNDRNLSAQEQQRLRDTENELQAALRTDSIRITHGERSADLVRTKYSSDASWTIVGTGALVPGSYLLSVQYRPVGSENWLESSPIMFEVTANDTR